MPHHGTASGREVGGGRHRRQLIEAEADNSLVIKVGSHMTQGHGKMLQAADTGKLRKRHTGKNMAALHGRYNNPDMQLAEPRWKEEKSRPGTNAAAMNGVYNHGNIQLTEASFSDYPLPVTLEGDGNTRPECLRRVGRPPTALISEKRELSIVAGKQLDVLRSNTFYSRKFVFQLYDTIVP